MKTIGITGLTGSGKTTFSEMLNSKLNAKVYHLDDILQEIGSDIKNNKLFKKFTKSKNKSDTTPANIINPNIKKRLFKNKFIESAYLTLSNKVFSFLAKPIFKRIFDEVKNSNFDYVIFEGTSLEAFFKKDSLDYKIFIRRPYCQRVNGILKRDGISKKDIILRDKSFQNIRQFSLSDFDYLISNNKNIDSLESKAKNIAHEILVKDSVLKSSNMDNYKFKVSRIPKIKTISEPSRDSEIAD